MKESFVQHARGQKENESCAKSCASNKIFWPNLSSQPQRPQNKREKRVAIRPLDKPDTHTQTYARARNFHHEIRIH